MAIDEADSSEKTIDRSSDSSSDSKSLSQSIWDDIKSSATSVFKKSDSTSSDSSASGSLDMSANIYGASDSNAKSSSAAEVLGLSKAASAVAEQPKDASQESLPKASNPTPDIEVFKAVQPSDVSGPIKTDLGSTDGNGDGGKGVWDKVKDAFSDLTKNISPDMIADNMNTSVPKDAPPPTDVGKEGGTGKPSDATTDTPAGKVEANKEDVGKDGEKILKDANELKPPLTDDQKAQLHNDLAEINKLPPEQRQKVVESLDQLAKHGDTKTHLTDEQREQLVTSLAHQLAHPESIKQGNKDTCVAANSEKTMAHNHPDTYADMVAKLATTGEYTAPGGKHIAMQLEDGKLPGLSDSLHQRSMASEVFQTGAINLALPEGQIYKSRNPGPPYPSGVDASTDTGERVVTKDGEQKFVGLDAGGKEQILNQLAPDDGYKARSINNADDLIKAYEANGGDKHPPLNVTITLGAESAGFSGMGDSGARLNQDDVDVRCTHINNVLNHHGAYISDADRARLNNEFKNLNPAEVKQIEDAYAAKYPGHTLRGDVDEQFKDAFRDVNKQEYATLQKLLNPDVLSAPTHAVSIDHIDKGPPAKVYYENTADTHGKDHSYPNGTPVPMDEFMKAMQAAHGQAVVHEGQYSDKAQVAHAAGDASKPVAAAGDAGGPKEGGVGAPPTDAAADHKPEAPPANTDAHAGAGGPEAKPVDKAAMSQAADDIYNAEHWYGNDNKKILSTLDGKSPAELREMDAAFQKSHPGEGTLREYLDKHMFFGDHTKAMELLKPLEKPADAPKDNPAEASAESFKKIHDDPQVKAEREKLEHQVDKLDPDQRQKFKDNMEAFEKRAASMDPPMSPERVKALYEQENKLLESDVTKPTNHAQRADIAFDVLDHAAHPTSIDQGHHNSCTAATLESKMYSTDPEAAAKLVTDVATTGKYTTRDGLEVTVPQSCISPDAEAVGHTDGDRGQASQIFEGTAINIKYAEYNKANPPAQLKYEELDPDPKDKNPGTGERVTDYSKHPPEVVSKNSTGITSPDIEHLNYEISGKHEKGMVIQNGSYSDGKSDGTTQVNSKEDLNKALTHAAGPPSHFPVVLRVHTGNEPFHTDSGGGSAGGSGGDSGGWHVVTVTGYNKDTGMVAVDNQWGSKADHMDPDKQISLAQLYQATKNANDLDVPDTRSVSAHSGDAPASQHAGDGAAAPKPVDQAAAKKDADEVYSSLNWWNEPDRLKKALEGKSPEQIQEMDKQFRAAHNNQSMEEYIKASTSESERASDSNMKKSIELLEAGMKPQEKPAEKPPEVPGNSPEDIKKCQEARTHLEGDIDGKVKDASQRKFMKDEVEKFEHRQPPVTAKERAEFYGQIDKLIEATDPPPRADLPKEGDRQKLALQVLEQANNPTSVDQGPHTTCAAAAMESRLYTQHPAAVARAVTEVATTGKLTPQPEGSGPPIEIHKSVLKPDGEAATSLKEGRGDGRSYASEVFQGAATTIEREGYRTDGKKSGREGDTGERYKDGGQEKNFEGVTGKEASDMEKKITGVTDKDIENDPKKAPPIIEGFDSSDTNVSGSQFPGRIAIGKGNETELKNRLQDLKKEGKLPCMIAVDTGQEPFATDSGGRPADGAGGKHFVTVTDIDDNGNVAIDNQWGPTADHDGGSNGQKGRVPVSQLSKALGHS